jgi:hypothetical protein
MLRMDHETQQVAPAGCRDAITHREPDVYPDQQQVEEALRMAHWARTNDPDYPNDGCEEIECDPEVN